MKWADHRIVLVVHGAHNAGKRIESGNHVGEAHQIAFELNCAMPRLKRKGSTPHVPEVSLKEIRRKLVGDHGPSKQLLRLHRQTLEVENIFLAQAKTGTVDPLTVPKQPRLGGGLHRLVPVKYLLRHRLRPIESWNR